MTRIYHERQLGGLCGVHCLNNLLQGPYFGPGDLAEIGVQLDLEEGQLYTTASAEGGAEGAEGARRQPSSYNVDSSEDGGNFSIQVLAIAMKRYQLELLPSQHPQAKDLMTDPSKAAEAFLCQYRDHWFAIREIASCWWNLNSTRKRPALVSPFVLGAWLAQLITEGYSIFLVCGGSLPTPREPWDGEEEETFHDMFDLLEHAKKSGGNPLAGGEADSEEFVIPPDPNDMVASMSPTDAAQFGLQFSQDVQTHYSIAVVDVQTLKQMGFRDPQIRAAMHLASGKVEMACRLLMHASQGADPRSGEELAQALQEGVFGLEQDDAPKHVLRLVTLLSSDEALLQAAAAHTSHEVLTDYAVAALNRRARAWSPEQLQAASVAVELLATLSTPSGRCPSSSLSPASASARPGRLAREGRSSSARCQALGASEPGDAELVRRLGEEGSDCSVRDTSCGTMRCVSQ